MVIHKHKFQELNICTWPCRTLVLGTFNPLEGPFADYYYGRIKSNGGYSNRFWPALSEFLISEKKQELRLLPGDLNAKIQVMQSLRFSCLDVIKEIYSPNDPRDIVSNGFADVALMRKNNKVIYNSKEIIEFINSKGVTQVVSSWGKGSTLSVEFVDQLKEIANNCPNAKFRLYELPPFGRPLLSNHTFGKMLFEMFQ